MFRNNLNVSVRRLARHKGSTFINAFGLALGLSCSLLIALFIRDELSFDRFYPDAAHIYRVTTELVDARNGNATEHLASTFLAVGPGIEESMPDVERVVRIKGNALNSTLVTAGDDGFFENHVFVADAGVFDLFGIEMIRGNPATALVRPNTVVLTEPTARKYFPNTDALGQTVSFNGKEYEVTGVMRSLPSNTHLRFDVLSSMATEGAEDWWKGREWGLLGYHTYVRLSPGVDPADVQARIADMAVPLDPESPPAFLLEPIADIHLHSQVDDGFSAGSDIRYIRLFGAIALLVLLIACINYMNLSTAFASRRAREIGVRKVVGAGRRQIAGQFLLESALMGLAAFVLAVVLVESALPWFNGLTGKSLFVDYAGEGGLMLLLALLAGLMAGSYPSVILSRFRPILALRGATSGSGRDRGTLRKALVVFQFTASIALITATIVVQRQLDHVQEERIGFEKDRLVVLKTTERLGENYAAFKGSLLSDPAVASVTTTTNVPGNRIFNEYGMSPDGGDPFYLTFSSVDFDFVRTMGLEILEGRDLSPQFGTDLTDAILVNETTARKMGWEEPVGQELFGRKVVGLIRDYLTMSSREEVRAGSFMPFEGVDRFVVVRLAPGSTKRAIDLLEETWASFVPGVPLNFAFVDTDIEALYRSEQRLGNVFMAFSLLTVLIACLGLFGLAAFAAERRTREIGIRKVMGSSVGGVVALLSREFMVLVLVALVVGGPLAWVAMNRWLADYAYRIEIGWGVPLAAGVICLAIALATVGWHALRAALADPVKSLRYE
jgi:putative ABC transport system permease protein